MTAPICNDKRDRRKIGIDYLEKSTAIYRTKRGRRIPVESYVVFDRRTRQYAVFAVGELSAMAKNIREGAERYLVGLTPSFDRAREISLEPLRAYGIGTA